MQSNLLKIKEEQWPRQAWLLNYHLGNNSWEIFDGKLTDQQFNTYQNVEISKLIIAMNFNII